jgi:hypothetical protein
MVGDLVSSYAWVWVTVVVLALVVLGAHQLAVVAGSSTAVRQRLALAATSLVIASTVIVAVRFVVLVG